MTAFLIVLILMALFVAYNFNIAKDTREPYLRKGKNIFALRVLGEVGDVPDHTRFIHNGTPHQNPAVREIFGVQWFSLFPFPILKQESFYPLTQNGKYVDFNGIRQNIRKSKLRKNQIVELTVMPKWAVKKAIATENATQLAKGVSRRKLKKRGL